MKQQQTQKNRNGGSRRRRWDPRDGVATGPLKEPPRGPPCRHLSWVPGVGPLIRLRRDESFLLREGAE